MKIMPPSAAILASTTSSAIEESTDDQDAFLATFMEEMADARTLAAVRTAPYTRNSTDGVTYQLHEVCFTQSELLTLQQNLLDAGAPAPALQAYNELCEQPGGATLAQVQEALQNDESSTAEPLSDDERERISSLLDSIDDSGALSSAVLNFMDQGKGLDAWKSILKALGSADSLSVSKDDVLLLAKGLGISAQGQALLDANFGKNGMLHLTGTALTQFMQKAMAELELRASQQEKLTAALDKTLGPLLALARQRMQQEENANSVSSRQTERSKIRIEQHVKEQGQAALDPAVLQEAQTKGEQSEQEYGQHGTQQRHQERTVSHEMWRDRSPQTQQAHNVTEKGRPQRSTHMGSYGATDMAFAQNFSAAAPTQSRSSSGISSYISARAATQIENGVLSAMRDGTSRLSLQLHPVELGSISLTLIARNGEISATIRSAKTETAEMLQQQLDVIRVNLEQQGIKVDKLDVRQEDLASDQWQSMDQHNAWQEENSRRQTNQRFRTLAGLRMGRETSQDGILAQSVQVESQTARYTGQALHIVA